MNVLRKKIVYRLFICMYVILFSVISLAAYFLDMKTALSGLAMYVVVFLSSELPIHLYYSGKPLLEFGSFYEAKTEDAIQFHFWSHFAVICIVFIVILSFIGSKLFNEYWI